ncbi:hypothetical protein, partial [Pasteurella multocida]
KPETVLLNKPTANNATIGMFTKPAKRLVNKKIPSVPNINKGPLILNLPGLLSFHILGEGLNPIDTSYPALVNRVLPTFLQGFF